MADAIRSIPPDDAAPMLHRFSSSSGRHVLVVPYSRIYDLDGFEENGLRPLESIVEALANPTADEASLDIVPEPAPQSITLNVSSSCNLSCGYCYAGRGAFGGAQPAPMDWSVARAAIEDLFDVADSSAPITIGFLGGEPFVNRHLLHRSVEHAASLARARRLDVRFSVTTNGTILDSADLELMRSHPFAVTVSIDGGAEIHDRQRPRNNLAKGNWEEIYTRISPLLSNPGKAKIAARATVTRNDFDIAKRLEILSAMGFPETGFSPLRVGPATSGPLMDDDWPRYLAALIEASEGELHRVRQGRPIRLTNFAIALKQLHRGAAAPYSCGAGGGYFSVAADGRWYACHRAIGKAEFDLGKNGVIDARRRRAFLERRHVHAQIECKTCWARYLCAGGCHQESHARSPASCDFVRDWLTYCLKVYCEASRLPDCSIAPSGEQTVYEET